MLKHISSTQTVWRIWAITFLSISAFFNFADIWSLAITPPRYFPQTILNLVFGTPRAVTFGEYMTDRAFLIAPWVLLSVIFIMRKPALAAGLSFISLAATFTNMLPLWVNS